jgi:AmiR/NasT family two-component response regulator
MTGNEDPAVRSAALDSGCIALLAKPFSFQELMDSLEKARETPHRGQTITRQ